MKKWNAAAIEELNIAETANGIFWWFNESCLSHNPCQNNNNSGSEGNEEGNEEGTEKGDNNTTNTLS